MKNNYDTCKNIEQWPKFTTMSLDKVKQVELFVGYVLSFGLLYFISKWFKIVGLWCYYQDEEGNYVCVEDSDFSFEVFPLQQFYVSRAVLGFSNKDEMVKLKVFNN